MSTRLAPAVRCGDAFSFEVKMPVHSSATSMPSAFHGNCVGSLIAVTLIGPLPQLMVSPLTVTSPGKRPCTESKRSRCALVSTGARSLTASTSISVRPASTIARRTLRPMRPNPLMATRTDMCRLLLGFLQTRQRRLGDFLGGYAEVLVKVYVGCAGPETLHADKSSGGTDDRVPALAHAGFDRDIDFRFAD